MSIGPLPDVYENILDNQIGILPDATDNVILTIGVSSQGPILTPVSFSQPDDLKTLFGRGPLVEAGAYTITNGRGNVIAVRANASSPAIVSDVTPTLKDGSTGSLATTGSTPNDDYNVIVEMTRPGANGAAAFRVSTDGGDNYRQETAVPSGGSYVVPNTGLTLVFTPGLSGFKVGDLFTFETKAPAMTNSDVIAAIDAALEYSSVFHVVHVVGTIGAAGAAAIDTKLAQILTQKHRLVFGLLQARDYDPDIDTLPEGAEDLEGYALKEAKRAVWDANLRLEFPGFYNHIGIAAGYSELASPLSGESMWRSIAWPVAAQIAKSAVHEHLGKIKLGIPVGVRNLWHDEEKHKGLDALGFITMRTIEGYGATAFITRGRVKRLPDSDLRFLEYYRTLAKACTLARFFLLPNLNDDVRVQLENGRINEADALSIEASVSAQLTAALTNFDNVSAVGITIKRENNILTNRTAPVRVWLTPKAYLENFFVDIGFFNPALATPQT